jgi:peptidoglycan/xylan/chitin deacetylase (PgdA/CDA1 family)
MIRFLYSFAHWLIRCSGTAFLIRHILARKKVTIVLYHNPPVEIFEKHLNYFSERYNLISLTDFSEAYYSKKLDTLPKYALVITLDDGWKENYKLLPAIRKYQFRPTVFLTSHIINTERHFWWTECTLKDLNRFKQIPNHQRLSELKDKYGYYPEKDYPGDRQALNLQEIEEMKEVVDFSLHTCYHPVLSQCSKEEIRKEIETCKTKIEYILGRPVDSLSYPNGDYNEHCIQVLIERGVKIARTTDAGWNDHTSDPYKLKVTGVSDNGSINKLIAELTGIPMYFQHLFQGSFNGTKKKN